MSAAGAPTGAGGLRSPVDAPAEGSTRTGGEGTTRDVVEVLTRLAPGGSIVYESPEARLVLGYEPDERVGAELDSTVHPDDVARLRAVLAALADDPTQTAVCRYRAECKDGSYLPVQSTVQASFDPGSRIVTELHLATRALPSAPSGADVVTDHERRCRVMVEAAPIGMALLDPDGRFLEVNRALCDILGRSPEELRTLCMSDVEHPGDADVGREARRSLSAGERQSFGREQRVVGPGGDIAWVAVTWALVEGRPGTRPCTVATFEDVTGRRDHRAALEARHRELERSNRDLEQFASVAAHNLSEPLRTMAGYLTPLLDQYLDGAGNGSDTVRDYLQQVNGAAQRLRAMIDGLLVHARLDSVFRPRERLSVTGVVADVRRSLRTLLRECGGTVVAAEPLPIVHADPVQMHQLILNLVTNSLKYRHPDRAPRVEIEGADHGEYWELRVSDNGIGIDPRHRQRVFGMFQRLHPADELEGSGIGLSMCKRIVEAHGGSIEFVDSRLGGITASIVLPKERELSGAPL